VSETRKDASDRALLKVLAEWPEPAVSSEDWESRALAVDAKVAEMATNAHIGGENFLEAPLPSLPEEGHKTAELAGAPPSSVSPGGRSVATESSKMSNSTSSTRERRSFQDLTRLAATPPPPSVRAQPISSPPSGVLRATEAAASDSGVVDLKAAAASDPMAATRAQTTPLASQPLFDEEDARNSQPNSGRISQAPMSAPAISSAVASAVLASQPAVQPAAKAADGKGGKKKSSGLLVIGGIAAVCAMAAGALVVVRSQQAKKAAQTVAIVTPAPEAKTDSPAPAAAPVAADPVATAAPVTTTPAPADDATDDAPKGVVGGGKLAANNAPKKSGGGAAAKGPIAKAAPADKIDPKLVAKDLPPAPGPTGALADAIKQSAAPTPTPASQDTAPAPPAANDPVSAAGSVPQKPSQGAVTGSIGAALPAARACLKQDEPVSRASITFGSNGSVSSVVVTGKAAGTPAEACIKAALSQAKVPAFAQPTYSANVTVRPAN
jgi:hypothetical protein